MRLRVVGFLLGIAALAGCSTVAELPANAELPRAARAEPQRYIVVTIRNPVHPQTVAAASTPRGYDAVSGYVAGGLAQRLGRAVAADYHLREVSSWPIKLLGVNCLAYSMPEDADPGPLIARLARDPRVESAQPLQTFTAQSRPYNDPYSILQNNVAQMAVAEAHALSRGGGVRVAVIDTGVAVNHPDLSTNVVTRNFVDRDAGAFREDAHGTAVAGVIAAVTDNGVGIVGIAPDVRLFLFKACWRTSAAGIKAACNSYTLAQALAAAVDAHADIINLSLAGPSDPLLARLVRRAIDAGIIVVGAVPPGGSRATFPTDIDAVIAVDMSEGEPADPAVLQAPGAEVVSLAPGGHYDFYSGSSLATAEVSGLVALLRARRPQLTGRDAMTLLKESAGAPGPEARGFVPNACKALATLLQRPNCSRGVTP